MADRKDFSDEFYNETMAEMAGTFFSRRKELESRLENFTRITAEVREVASKALRRWRTFFTLLVDERAALDFCRESGVDARHIPPLAASGGGLWSFRLPFAFTEAGRYRKSVRHAYQAMRQATLDYADGCYGSDPKNPRKKILLPNYCALKNLAEKINHEIKEVNNGQTPSTVLAYAKSLDPGEGEREDIMGGLAGEDVVKLDREMAFTPIDFNSLDLPELPAPPALEEVRDRLDALSDTMFADHREQVRQAMASAAR